MAHLKQSNDQMTPDASRKRNIMETVSPSDGPDGEYVNSENPVRRKEYSSPDAGGDTNFIVEGKSFDLSEMVKSPVCSQEVMDAISAAIVLEKSHTIDTHKQYLLYNYFVCQLCLDHFHCL
jgi:hypothetical protein